MNIHIPSVVSFLKAMPIGRNRMTHLNLLANAIDCELTGRADTASLWIAVLDLFLAQWCGVNGRRHGCGCRVAHACRVGIAHVLLVVHG